MIAKTSFSRLGAIAKTLRRGTDSVIAGRFVDSAVTLGAGIDASDWDGEDWDKLATLEAVKMQREILAGIDGIVTMISAPASSQVATNDLILENTPQEEA